MYENNHATAIQALLDRERKMRVMQAKGVNVTEADFAPIVSGHVERAHRLPTKIVEPPQETAHPTEPLPSAAQASPDTEAGQARFSHEQIPQQVDQAHFSAEN